MKHPAHFVADGHRHVAARRVGRRPAREGERFRVWVDVLVRTRDAAAALGATKMDRPEDVERKPDFNIDSDSVGNLWIAGDGQPNALGDGSASGPSDGLFGVPTEGGERGHLEQLFAGVTGCEVASRYVTNDDPTVF